jgi:hypothetical protein
MLDLTLDLIGDSVHTERSASEGSWKDAETVEYDCVRLEFCFIFWVMYGSICLGGIICNIIPSLRSPGPIYMNFC